MGLVLFSVSLIALGFFCMWMAIFSKKQDLKEFGQGVPTDLFDFLIMGIYRLFPSFLRRILLFILGLAIEAFAFYLLIR